MVESLEMIIYDHHNTLIVIDITIFKICLGYILVYCVYLFSWVLCPRK